MPEDVAPEAAVPALFVLDPSATFATTATTAATLAVLALGQFAPPAVVGVAPEGGFLETFGKRFRDMTPSPNAAEQYLAAASHGLGQGDSFLTLLVEEIAPYVEDRHGLTADGRGLSGWSLGGLLTCHALLTRAADFARFLAVSPSLWWDDGLLVKRSAALAASMLRGKTVYIGTGELENDVDRMWPPVDPETRELLRSSRAATEMITTAQEFGSNVAAAGARVRQELIAGEHHATVWGAAMTRGLVELYGTTATRR
jgi:predicted alpha/beta superfamily hydrolase